MLYKSLIIADMKNYLSVVEWLIITVVAGLAFTDSSVPVSLLLSVGAVAVHMQRVHFLFAVETTQLLPCSTILYRCV